MTDQQSTIVMEEVTDPQRIAEAHARRERFDRNWGWLRAHAQEVYDRYRGKCISVAGEELFVGDTPQEVIARAAAAHPDDDGSFVHYIPLKKMARVYGNSRIDPVMSSVLSASATVTPSSRFEDPS